MNRAQLDEAVLKSSSDIQTKAAASRVVDAVIGTISKELSKGRDVQIVGFGSFRVMKRKARNGRNPSTGESMKIPAKKVVKFRPGSNLNNSINKKRAARK